MHIALVQYMCPCSAGQKMRTLRKTQNEKRFRKRKIRRKEGIERWRGGEREREREI